VVGHSHCVCIGRRYGSQFYIQRQGKKAAPILFRMPLHLALPNTRRTVSSNTCPVYGKAR